VELVVNSVLTNFIVKQLEVATKQRQISLISRGTGLSIPYLMAVRDGRVKNPGVSSVEILLKYFHNDSEKFNLSISTLVSIE
jgi:hypothetical protein